MMEENARLRAENEGGTDEVARREVSSDQGDPGGGAQMGGTAVIFIAHHPSATLATMGFIPDQISERDPRPAAEQFATNAPDGWRPFNEFIMSKTEALTYPGDPPMRPLCELHLRDERIVLYPHSWVAIIQADGRYEVSRLT